MEDPPYELGVGPGQIQQTHCPTTGIMRNGTEGTARGPTYVAGVMLYESRSQNPSAPEMVVTP